MDPKTNIKLLKAGDETPPGAIKLTPEQYHALKNVPEEMQVEELALIQFRDNCKKVGAVCGIDKQNAFRKGFRACIMLLAAAQAKQTPKVLQS
jgi:hypothetical protein